MDRWPQGLWVVTPDGKTLAFHYHKNTPGVSYTRNQELWVEGTVEMLEAAVVAAGTLPRREARTFDPFPDRGVGSSKDGGARLAVSVIGLRNGQQDGPPAVDSVSLSRPDWAAFAPPPGKTEWAIPAEVGRRFAPALSPLTDSIFVPRPDNMTRAEVTGTVVRTTDGIMVVRYAGQWESLHYRDGDKRFPIRAKAAGDGIGVYDPSTQQFRSMLWVLKGTYQNGATAVPTAAVVEWRAETKNGPAQ